MIRGDVKDEQRIPGDGTHQAIDAWSTRPASAADCAGVRPDAAV